MAAWPDPLTGSPLRAVCTRIRRTSLGRLAVSYHRRQECAEDETAVSWQSLRDAVGGAALAGHR